MFEMICMFLIFTAIIRAFYEGAMHKAKKREYDPLLEQLSKDPTNKELKNKIYEKGRVCLKPFIGNSGVETRIRNDIDNAIG